MPKYFVIDTLDDDENQFEGNIIEAESENAAVKKYAQTYEMEDETILSAVNIDYALQYLLKRELTVTCVSFERENS